MDGQYLPRSEVIKFDAKLNGKELYDWSFDLGKFNRTCFNVPYTFKVAQFCVDFQDTVINTTYVGTCPSLEVDVEHTKIAHVDFGCLGFHI